MAAGFAAIQAPAVDAPRESRRANPCSKATPIGRRTGGRMAPGDPSDAVISRQASSGTHSRTAPRSGASHQAASWSKELAGVLDASRLERGVVRSGNGVSNLLLGEAQVRAKLHGHAGEFGAECVDYPLRRARRLACRGHPCLGVSCDCRPGEVLWGCVADVRNDPREIVVPAVTGDSFLEG